MTSIDRKKTVATKATAVIRLTARNDRSGYVRQGNCAPAHLHWVAHADAPLGGGRIFNSTRHTVLEQKEHSAAEDSATKRVF